MADGTVTTVQTMPWDFKPWGCGSSTKGSCNNGWIQFEICEDGLTDKAYFDKVYKEACEITAYLCKLYNIDPKGTVTYNGVKVPTILCHQDSYKLKLGSNHSDIYHWFPKHGKSMEDVRNDVAELLGVDEQPSAPTVKEMYRVRKSWADSKSQIGAYTILENAVAACKEGYSVFDSQGNVVYQKMQEIVIPTPVPTPAPIPSITVLKKGSKGNEVKELQNKLNALGYNCGKADGIFGAKTETAVKQYQKDTGLIVDGMAGPKTLEALKTAKKPEPQNSILVLKQGSKGEEVKELQNKLNSLGYNCGTADGIFGAKTTSAVKSFQKNNGLVVDGKAGPKTMEALKTAKNNGTKVKVTASALNVRAGAGTNYKVVKIVRKGQILTIVSEKSGWGKLSDGSGWVSLGYTKKV